MQKQRTLIIAMVTSLGFPLLVAAAPATRLQPSHLIYLGAFAIPGDDFAYGGRALAYYPSGDPTSANDGFSGSLYIAGLTTSGLVAEIGIPAPVEGASDYNALPVASILRGPADPTGGWFENCTYDPECQYREIGGLAYLPNQGKLAWNLLDWYNTARIDQDSLGWCDLDFSEAAGVWHIGRRDGTDLFHNAKASDYLFTAPVTTAATYLGGRSLLAGQHREAGALGGSQGPSLYATAPWQDGNPPVAGTELDARALLYYRENYNCVWFGENNINPLPADGLCEFPDYRAADSWQGGAWIETTVGSAVMFFGRKGIGPNCYDTAENCSDPCSDSKGYHAYPYAPRILFYDMDELLAAADGERDPWTVLPYASHDVSNAVLRRSDCAALGGAAYDRTNQRLYVAEHLAGEWGETAIHVWEITQNTDPTPDPTTPVTEYLGPGNDQIELIGTANTTTRYLDFGGNDTFTISPNLVGSMKLVDRQATTLILPVGLTIDAAKFLPDGLRFTINGHSVTLLGNASQFSFVFGGEAGNANLGQTRDYTDTAKAFGASIPAAGAPPESGTVLGTIVEGGGMRP